MRERQDLILGGGLSGMTAAHTLQQAGETWWQLYERESRLGGRGGGGGQGGGRGSVGLVAGAPAGRERMQGTPGHR